MGDWASDHRELLANQQIASLLTENKALAAEVGRLRRDLYNALTALRSHRGDDLGIPLESTVGS